jgi:S-adenosylmethionine hydrolase
MPCITLMTDFGTRDWFVGTMKGVIFGLAPRTRIIDLTHEIAPGDVRSGAFALASSYSYFPRHTVHVAVVDPGVGTKRRAIAVRTSNYFFVGPDSGLLAWALAKEKVMAIHCLENPRYLLPQVSSTFHGRDVFAPVAAHLSRGLAIQRLGRVQKDFVRLKWPEPIQSEHELRGEVIYIDRFGNAITNLPAQALSSLKGVPTIFVGQTKACSLAATYQAVARGKPVAVMGSSGFLEIAINEGNASRSLKLRVGTVIKVR